MTATPQHHIIKETSETVSKLLQTEFKGAGYKRVHIVEQAPKPDVIEGKLPAVSVYLYQVSLDPFSLDGMVSRETVEVEQDDGSIREFSRRRRLWLRLDYLISTWAQTPEDEQLLMGLVVRALIDNPVVTPDKWKGESFDEDYEMFLQFNTRLDEGTLARFWGSLQQPVRPALQIWTHVAIVPTVMEEFKRVEQRTLAYRNLNEPDSHEHGPSGGGISLTRSDLDGDDDGGDGGGKYTRGGLTLGGKSKK